MFINLLVKNICNTLECFLFVLFHNIYYWSGRGRKHLARGRAHLAQGRGNLILGPAMLIRGNALKAWPEAAGISSIVLGRAHVTHPWNPYLLAYLLPFPRCCFVFAVAFALSLSSIPHGGHASIH